MKIKILSYALLLVGVFYITSCNKFSTDNNVISKGIIPPHVALQDSIKAVDSTGIVSVTGKLIPNHTYNIYCDLYIPTDSTLTIQAGDSLIFHNDAGIIVKGNLFSLGNQSNQIWFTAPLNFKHHTDDPTRKFKATSDSAFNGIWKGIAGASTCNYLILKWTHVEYAGGIGSTNPVSNNPNNPSNFYTFQAKSAPGAASYPLFFSNTNGIFVFEDSWLYGCPDDAIRVGGAGGRFAIMRCTFEKYGKTGGDGCNIKTGGVGVLAYNMCIGGATNSLKGANTGAAPLIPTCQVDSYNNTIVNSGHRNTGSGKGGSIDYEQGARGQVYNNLEVNCKYGIRLNQLFPDTTYMYAHYGYNYYWADSVSVANQVFETVYGSVTKPVATDFPNPFSYLPANYNYLPDAAYSIPADPNTGLVDMTKFPEQNPMFVNYPLPVPAVGGKGYYLGDLNAIGVTNPFDFRLKSGSPCIGKGYTGFTPIQNIPIDPVYGLSEFTPPGSDVGCYQSNGGGNKHHS